MGVRTMKTKLRHHHRPGAGYLEGPQKGNTHNWNAADQLPQSERQYAFEVGPSLSWERSGFLSGSQQWLPLAWLFPTQLTHPI